MEARASMTIKQVSFYEANAQSIEEVDCDHASKGHSHAPDREADGSKWTKKRARRKKIRSQPEVQQQPAQEEMHLFDFIDMPFDLKPLAYYAQNSMRDGT